jgi:beta-1,4-mannosyltransferase
VSLDSNIRVLAWPAYANRNANPYNAILYDALADLGVVIEDFTPQRLFLGNANILHLHWAPTNRIRGASKTGVLAHAATMLFSVILARARGMRVVWTPHNLDAHDRPSQPSLERQYWKLLPRYVDGILSLTHSGIDLVKQKYPGLRDVPAFVTPHPHYQGAYPAAVDRSIARAELGIPDSARVLAFVGNVKPYKNVPALIRAFSGLQDDDAILIVAGKQNRAARQAIDEVTGSDSRVRIFDGFIPDDRLQYFLAAADVIALPFRDVLNSGSVVLALSFARPVLVPRTETFAELARTVGSEWVMIYDGEIDSAKLSRALDVATSPRASAPPLDSMQPARVAQLTLDAYHHILERVRITD